VCAANALSSPVLADDRLLYPIAGLRRKEAIIEPQRLSSQTAPSLPFTITIGSDAKA